MTDSSKSAADPGIAGLAARLLRARDICITAHASGDGDSVGSTTALARGLRSRGKSVRIVLPDLPDRYAFLTEAAPVTVPEPGEEARALEGADLGILLDAGEASRCGRLEPAFFSGERPVLCLDHHLGTPGPEFELAHVDPASPSTGSLVLELLDHLGVELDLPLARSLWVAIATDTGWFRFPSTNPACLRAAARLLELDPGIDELYRRIYETHSAGRARLLGEVLSRMELAHGGLLAWSHVDLELLERCDVERQELEGVIDSLRTIEGVEIAALVSQVEGTSWKVSLRSRSRADVQVLARRLGGGGHARAAGGRLEGEIERARQTLLDQTRQQLELDGLLEA